MKVLVFDTETTNLIKKDLTDVHILQLAWILYDTETNSCEQNDYILKVPVQNKKQFYSWYYNRNF
jgi:hypothetical protein